MDTVIHVQIARIDGGEANPDVLEEVAFGEVRTFADGLNKESSMARMVFDYPIFVKGNLTITLLGVPNKMSDSDQEIFLSVVETGIVGLLATKNDTLAFELDSVSVLYQESSSGARQRMLRLLQNTDYNKVHMTVLAVCGNPDFCTDEALQALLTNEGPAYGSILEEALKNPPAVDILYFQNVNGVTVGATQSSLPDIPPVKVFENEDDDEDKQKFPKWLGILLFISLLAGATLICWDMRRRKNSKGGQKLDEAGNNQVHDEDSEYSERADKRFESEEVVQPQLNLVTASGANIGEEDNNSIGDEFSLDGGDVFLAGPDQDAQFETNNNSHCNASISGESFPAPRRTRQVNRGTSKRISRNIAR